MDWNRIVGEAFGQRQMPEDDVINELAQHADSAYQAARAGIEWGVYQALRTPPCAAATLNFPGTTLSSFTTTVTCTPTVASEGGAPVTITEITATACDAPPCPNAAPGAQYVERRLTIIVSD